MPKSNENIKSELRQWLHNYPALTEISGEILFWAEGGEKQLDRATHFFSDKHYTLLKANGLRDKLYMELDRWMDSCNETDGLLKLGGGKVSLEWLDSGQASYAADVRREDFDIRPWLQSLLTNISKNAIAHKKSEAKERYGNEKEWKKVIWYSPQKNRAIKECLIQEGQKLGLQVLPDQKKRGEWLYDLVWRQLDANKNIIGMPLAVEIEVSDSSLSGIRYDFNKLLQAHALNKLMVFQVKHLDDANLAFERLRQSIDAFPHLQENKYLLCAWITKLNEFQFRAYDSEAS